MKGKRIALALVVILLAFSVGYMTFKAAELFKFYLTNSGADCTEHVKGGTCAGSRDAAFQQTVPRR
ncbi:MAG: hypothetical protein IPM63_08735 [Acidobacteriota bacterium]|nr:MAG: hypothetical protein IPM63_08735 [Acidobacteriota bacterium]